ncbi:uncharacterized protein LOC114534547 [Dendronephthya gigantea]|uniref:uncharacterized protein LOC114534547 n=1 Tax=Dendronephthya gigantea TaxID=151771 RepID=UPI00106DACF7|nr:uncharacterized protein LOC114534547 [Dendronephthya gigantea]
MSVDLVLKLTWGLFVKKSRSAFCKSLEDGSLSAQKLRSSLINRLEDLKKKFDDFARKDLLTSASNLQEGLGYLNALLDQQQDTSTLPPSREDNKAMKHSNASSNLPQASYSGRDSLIDVDSALELTEEIKKMNSNDHFKAAMNLFEKANTKATEAFHNKALTLEDQVWATKLRVQSRFLLSMENPSLARESCRLYLDELHRLSSVVATFRSHLEGGVWYDKVLSLFTHEKRQELVFSVSLINFIVFKFLKKFTSGAITVYDWPNLVGSGEWTYNPLIPARSIHVELQRAGIELPHLVVFEDLCGGMHLAKSVKRFAVKSDGDLILGTVDPQGNVDVGKITTQTNETVDIIKTDSTSVTITTQHLLFLAIDSGDNMYLLTDRDCTHSGAVSVAPRCCELFAFDSEVNEIYRCEVGCCQSNKAIAPTPHGFVMVRYNMKSICDVEFYENRGGKVERTSTFQVKLWENLLIAFTNKEQVIAVEEGGCSVRVYEKDGQLVREFQLYGGKNECCVSMASNHLTGEVVFVTAVGAGFYLSTYVPETGERRHCTRLTVFGRKNEGKKIRMSLPSLLPEDPTICVDKTPRLTSHCEGPMAIVSSEYVLYIQ